MLLLSKAAKPTSVPKKYISDGSGRDSFVAFTSNQRPPHSRFSMKTSKSTKIVAADPSPAPRFVPDGSGRDMFMQSNVQPSTGVHIGRGMKVSPMKKVQSTGSILAKPLPNYVSNGHGRDAYVVGRTYSPPKSTSFMLKPPSKKPCARTDPPPRFRPTGQRDSFNSPILQRQTSPIRSKDEGFRYGSPHLSRWARYKHGKKGGYKRKSLLTNKAQDAYIAQLAQTKIGNTRKR